MPVAEPQPGASGQRCDENDPDERAVRSRGGKTHPAIIAFAFAYTCACQQARDDHVTAELASIIDLIRYGASRFAGAGLTFGHSYDSPLDEASHLVLHSLHLPHDLPPAYGAARLTAAEKKRVLALIERRVRERKPVAYLTGEAWFAGLKFKSDARALVPRSPIAELIQQGFSPWLDDRAVTRVLDLCTGSGCIGIAMAVHNPEWRVDLADISDDALSLARENIEYQDVADRVQAIRSDLFEGLAGKRY
ncbi:MAG TPA: 50S ribosomal protein L3 N(5)-glutamine methyltransferase, partial [Nevskia sp.]|nr:50S ribosomal protein L3 N(5)-glutamine methyltransferase [Nevskia sp.]